MNIVSSAAQVVVSTAVMFVLYRYLVKTLGADLFGVWAVVLATGAVGSVANLGMTASGTRFVARAWANERRALARVTAETVVLTTAVSVGLFLCGLLPVADWGLQFVLHGRDLDAARDVLALALLSTWVMTIGACVQGCLDGVGYVYLRSVVGGSGALFLLAASVVLVPKYGLRGLAYAQIAQGLVVVCCSAAVLRRFLPEFGSWPWRWSSQILREVYRYGIALQGATVTRLLLDPMSKWLAALYGGPAASGYLELANRVVVQVRAVIVAAHQGFLPKLVEIESAASSDSGSVYYRTLRMLVALAVVVCSGTFLLAGDLARAWMGDGRDNLAILICVMSIGWMANLVSNASYFADVASGSVRRILVSHITMGCANVIGGVILGHVYGVLGVAVALALALGIGSFVQMHLYHAAKAMPLTQPGALAKSRAFLVTMVVAISGTAILRTMVSTDNPVALLLMQGGLFGMLSLLALRMHPDFGSAIVFLRTDRKGW